jgi:hypothetical protein
MSRDTLQVALRLSRQCRQAVEAVRRETPAQEAEALSALTAGERDAFLDLLDKALASTEGAIGSGARVGASEIAFRRQDSNPDHS